VLTHIDSKGLERHVGTPPPHEPTREVILFDAFDEPTPTDKTAIDVDALDGNSRA